MKVPFYFYAIECEGGEAGGEGNVQDRIAM